MADFGISLRDAADFRAGFVEEPSWWWCIGRAEARRIWPEFTRQNDSIQP